MDSIRHDSSLTTMQHHPLQELEILPFDDELLAIGFDSSSEVYSLDEFRRIYNDAVESMHHYRYLFSRQKDETERMRQEARHYEDLLEEHFGQ